MAKYITYRFKSFNGNDYDTYHLESRSSMILRFDAEGQQLAGNKANVESSLSALESSVSTLQSTVEGIVSTGGQANVIEGVKVKGTKLTPDASKNVDIPAATNEAYGVVKVAGSVTDGGADPVTGDAVHSYASGAIAQTTTNKNAIATLNGADTVAGSVAKKIKDAIGALDVTDNAVTNNFVTAVSETDGKIKVSRATPTIANVSGLTDALGKKLETSLKGKANGLAELDDTGKVPAGQLPSYVDDVIEGYKSGADFYEDSAHTASKKITGEGGKIYVDLHTNVTYRWSGTAYVEISASLALGETSSTAYRGDRGAIAYTHSQATHARTDATATAASTTNGKIKINGSDVTVYTHPAYTNRTSGLYKITVDATGHVSAVAAVEKADITALGIPGSGYTHPTHTAHAAGIYKITVDSLGHISAATAAAKGDLTGIIGNFGAASASAAGSTGLVPAPAKGDQAKFLRADGKWIVPTDTNTDTKNTAGATNSTAKLFLVGAASQGANPQTYSNSSVYASAGRLYSNGRMLLDIQVGGTQPTNQAAGDLWFETV
nr:MAG TPA: Peptidase [Caudoviricetes sp.]